MDAAGRHAVVEGADKLTGGPITVQFDGQPESVVLESLLRGTAGYILYPRMDGSSGASIWQSVSILRDQPSDAALLHAHEQLAADRADRARRCPTMRFRR